MHYQIEVKTTPPLYYYFVGVCVKNTKRMRKQKKIAPFEIPIVNSGPW